MADDKLQIPDADRIHNISPLPDGFDPNDDTLLNADWVMRIFDKIVNGEYDTKPFTTYASVASLPATAQAGQTAYVETEPSHFYLYDGITWVQMPNKSEAGSSYIAGDGITISGSEIALSNDVEETIANKAEKVVPDSQLNEQSYNLVINKAIAQGIDTAKVEIVDNISSTLPAAVQGTKVLDTTTNKIFTSIHPAKINSARYTAAGTLTVSTDGTISNFGENNYLTYNGVALPYLAPFKAQFTLSSLVYHSGTPGYYSPKIVLQIKETVSNALIFEIIDEKDAYSQVQSLRLKLYAADGQTVLAQHVASLRNAYGTQGLSGATFVLDYKYTTVNLYADGEQLLASYDLSIENWINKTNYQGGINAITSVSYLEGIDKLYGYQSFVPFWWQGQTSLQYVCLEDTTDVGWDTGTQISAGKLIVNKTDNKIYRFDGSNLIAISGGGDIGQLYTYDGISGTMLDTELELGNAIMVYRNGLLQTQTEDYSYVVDGSTISFIESLQTTDKINVINATSSAIDMSAYQQKAQTVTIDTASVTIANIQANTNYVFTSTALTDITFTACETSREESTIEFTTGSSDVTFTDNSGISWAGGNAPVFYANTHYLIVIFNKIGFCRAI